MSLKKIIAPTGETRWEVRIRIQGRGSPAIRKRFDRRADAESYLDSLRDRMKQNRLESLGMPQEFEESSFEKEATFWLETRGPQLRPSTLKRARAILKELTPKYGHLTPLALHPGRLTLIQGDLLKRGLKGATVNRMVNLVTAILNHSANCRRIQYNPSSGFRRLKEVRQKMNFWEEREARDFLTWASVNYPPGSSKRWIYLVYMLALNTGLRAGEVWGLKAENLIRGGTMLHIKGQIDRLTMTFSPCKDSEERFVPCNADLRREFEAWIRTAKLKPKDWVFQTQTGEPICHDNFRNRQFEPDVRHANMRALRFHDLRHTAATLMIAKGVDVPTVQSILGHSKIETTMGYVHVLGASIERAAQLFSITAAPRTSNTEPRQS